MMGRYKYADEHFEDSSQALYFIEQRHHTEALQTNNKFQGYCILNILKTQNIKMISSLWQQLATAIILLLLVSGEELNLNCERDYCDYERHATTITLRQPSSESLLYKDFSGRHIYNDQRLQIPHERYEETHLNILTNNRRIEREVRRSRENRERHSNHRGYAENERENFRQEFERNPIVIQYQDFPSSNNRLADERRSHSGRMRNEFGRSEDRIVNRDDHANRQRERIELNDRRQEQHYRERETNENRLRFNRFENPNDNREILRQAKYNRFDERSGTSQRREQEERRVAEREIMRQIDNRENSKRTLAHRLERRIEREDMMKQSRQFTNREEPARVQARQIEESSAVTRLEARRAYDEIKVEKSRQTRNDLRLEINPDKHHRDDGQEIVRDIRQNREQRREIRFEDANREKYFEFRQRGDNPRIFEQSVNAQRDNRVIRVNAQHLANTRVNAERNNRERFEDNFNRYDRLNQYSRLQIRDISRNRDELIRERSDVYEKHLRDHRQRTVEINFEQRDTVMSRENSRENLNLQKTVVNRNNRSERTDRAQQADRINAYSLGRDDSPKAYETNHENRNLQRVLINMNKQEERVDGTRQFAHDDDRMLNEKHSQYSLDRYTYSRREMGENLNYFLTAGMRRHEMKRFNRLQVSPNERIDRGQRGLSRESYEIARDEFRRFTNERNISKGFIGKPDVMLKKIYIALAQGALICLIIVKALKSKEEIKLTINRQEVPQQLKEFVQMIIF
uniref:Trichohyalin-like n=1 Tax=Glossina pallidipes TaxID=7398 RepID=A0A1A9Z660_GLOPL